MENIHKITSSTKQNFRQGIFSKECNMLKKAILGRNIELTSLMESGLMDINTTEKSKNIHSPDVTSLHQYVEEGRHDQVLTLLRAGSDVNQYGIKENPDGRCVVFTPIMMAALKGDLKMIELLEEHRADINLVDPYNSYGCVLMGVLSGNPQCVQYLLTRGANIHFSGKLMNPLVAAIRQYDPGWYHEGEEDIITTTIKENSIHLISILLDHGADVNLFNAEDEQSPLTEAVQHNDTRILKLLLEAGGDPNLQVSKRFFNKTPLTIAIRNGNTDAVKILIKYGADINIKYVEYTPTKQVKSLVEAALDSRLDIVLVLIKAGCKVNKVLSDSIKHIYRAEVKSEGDIAETKHRSQSRLKYLTQLVEIVNNPKSLKLCCRNYIRCTYGIFSPDKGRQLPIPKLLCDYILCSDL